MQTHDVTPVNVSNIRASALMAAPSLSLVRTTQNIILHAGVLLHSILTRSITFLIQSVLALSELSRGMG
jgi:hypothetical protein